MERIDAVVQSYPWGSRTLLAELMGNAAPTERPQAEAWFGAHPLSPSSVGGRPLTDVIAEDPAAALGRAAEFTHDCIGETARRQPAHWYGLAFEDVIKRRKL